MKIGKTKARKIIKAFYPNYPKGLKSIDLKVIEKEGKILIFDVEQYKNEKNFDFTYLLIEGNRIVFDCADGELSRAEIQRIFENVDFCERYENDQSYEIVENGKKIEII